MADQTYTVVHNGTSNTVTFDPPLPESQSVDSVTLEQSTLQGTKRVTLPAADIDLSPDGTVLTLTVPANAFDFTADDPVTAQVSFADSTTYYAGTINTGTVTAGQHDVLRWNDQHGHGHRRRAGRDRASGSANCSSTRAAGPTAATSTSPPIRRRSPIRWIPMRTMPACGFRPA